MSEPHDAVQPQIVDRLETPYLGVRRSITMEQFDQVADRIPEIMAFLGERHIAPAGPPFFRYNVIDMEGELDVEVGVPLADPIGGHDEMNPGILPAGRYATLTHVGHPDQLIDVTAQLLAWGESQSFDWDVDASGRRWGARLEFHLTDPTEQPDMNQWATELAVRLAD